MPGQTATRVFRLAVLEDRHCDEKGCTRPLCLHGAIAAWAGVSSTTTLDETPPACPLRAFPAARLAELRDASPA
jgi:hypothetical protein